MANQGYDRRTVLEMLAKAAVASQFPGFSRWVFAGQHEHGAEAPQQKRSAGSYQPLYFNPAEYRSIELLTELIIPADETGGAAEAGVSEFIDFMAAHGEEEIREPMRHGLAWLDKSAQAAHNASFAGLAPGQQRDLLTRIAYRSETANQDVQGRHFFQLIRRYTVIGYYTSRVGMQELDYPGLRLYSASPACPHTGDPEHLHLPAPRF